MEKETRHALLAAAWFLALAAIAVMAFLFVLAQASALEVPPGQALGPMYPIPCDGYLLMYDLDGNTQDAEILAVFTKGEEKPRALVYFGEGPQGGFLKATVHIPGHTEMTYGTQEDFNQAFPSPCAIVKAEGRVQMPAPPQTGEVRLKFGVPWMLPWLLNPMYNLKAEGQV